MKKTAKEKAEKKVKKLLEKLLKFTPNSEEKTPETFLKELTAKASAILLLEFTQESNVTIEELEYLIGQGADVNAKGKYGVTPLHNLIYNGEYKAVEFLLSKGANPAMCNSIGRNSLHVAAFKNNLGIVELLLKQGTLTDEDKNKKDDDKNQPLYWAIKNENYAMAEKLLKNGANPNLDSTEGNLVRVAVESGEEKIGLLLLKSGAEIEPNREHKPFGNFPDPVTRDYIMEKALTNKQIKKQLNLELFLKSEAYKQFSREADTEFEKSMELLSETVETELFGKLTAQDSDAN